MQLIPMGLVTEENRGGNSLEENLQRLLKDRRAFAVGTLLQWFLENHSDTCELERESPHTKEKSTKDFPYFSFPVYPSFHAILL